MTAWTLVKRNLRFHARAHLGVLLGAVIGSAALVGALVVGDSVRESLHDLALSRLGRVTMAMVSNDRFFQDNLGDRVLGPTELSAAVLQLRGIASSSDASARANQVQVLGVDTNFWRLAGSTSAMGPLPADGVWVNEALAAQLHARTGDTVVIRVQKPSLVSRDAPLTPQEDFSAALRLRLLGVVPDAQAGRFSIQANQVSPFNAFVNRAELQQRVAQTGRANLLLTSLSPAGTNSLTERLQTRWELEDAELELRTTPAGEVELRTGRVFLDPPEVLAALGTFPGAGPITTYFVNELKVGSNTTPYSMVTAMGAPLVPAEMANDEVMINDWLADDLKAGPGDRLRISYFVIGAGRLLEERQDEFKIRGVVPLDGPAGDRSLMPDFPGLAKAESSRDWDAGFPIQIGKIRGKDEQYWTTRRGTPKAFVTLAAGKRMWANRFGDYTALRFPAAHTNQADVRSALQKSIHPAALGFEFQPVREQALAASSQSMDFGGLFIGFSFFLIAAAMLLMALLFQFGLERRGAEIGTLLAIGFRPRQVRRILLFEGVCLALVGGVIGALGGVGYARLMVYGLTHAWREAVGNSALSFHVTAQTLILGCLAAALVSALTIWISLWRQGRRPARELLVEGGGAPGTAAPAKSWQKSWGTWIAMVSLLSAFGMVVQAIRQHETSSAETFFSIGSLVLVGGLGVVSAWLGWLGRAGDFISPASSLTKWGLGLRGGTRRRGRSLSTVALLASGVFLIVAVGAFRQDSSKDARLRASGTGGFSLIGEATIPVTYDLNGKPGRDFYGLNSADLEQVSLVAFRVRDGDDASCLNLNRAQKPRILGVTPEALQSRHAFTFAEVLKGLPQENPWLLLRAGQSNVMTAGSVIPEIPAIGDENSILWALGKKVGDTVDYADERGRPVKFRLVGSVANSILQGSLIIDEAAFLRLFPGESGYRMFLVDTPSNSMAGVAMTLTRALQDTGMQLTSAADRLNAFNAVQNTYLSTFQVLGGLGLLLGSAGLGIVVLRNVQDRRAELALLLAVGFRRRALSQLVMGEHGALLVLGLLVGVLGATCSVLPVLLTPGSQIPYGTLAWTLGGVLVNGLVWAWLATRFALRGRLLEALRND